MQRESQQQHLSKNHAYNSESMTGHAVNIRSRNGVVHKSNRPLRQQFGVWRKPSANVIVLLVLANEATMISKACSKYRSPHTYGVDERLLKYCFLGSASLFSTYTIQARSDDSEPWNE